MGARLVLIGSCRGPADQERIDNLKRLVKDLNLQVSLRPPLQPFMPSLPPYKLWPTLR